MKVSTKNFIEVQDWDELVQKTYGRPYCFQQQDGCKDRGIHELIVPDEETYDEEMKDSIPDVINGNEMGVKFSAWLARDPKEWNGKKEDERYLDLFWERNFYPEIKTVANDLYKKGLLEAGEYVINIDW